jgi:circadian clock protein KaiC
MSMPDTVPPRAATGIAGLDEIMDGGLARNRLHLLEGSPGTGKTTIALQFLMAGAEAGEVGMYVSLAETDEELRDGAASHGWTLGPNIEIMELVPPESLLDADQHQSLLYSSDLELGGRSSASSPRSSGCSRSASSSTACPRSASWRRAHCATAARSWH